MTSESVDAAKIEAEQIKSVIFQISSLLNELALFGLTTFYKWEDTTEIRILIAIVHFHFLD